MKVLAMYLAAIVAASLPVAVVLAFVSQISTLSPAVMSLLAVVPRTVGYAALILTAACSVALWALVRNGTVGKTSFWTLWWVCMLLATTTAALTVLHHPCFAIFALAFLGPFLLYPLRHLALPHIETTDWFNIVWVATACASAMCFAVWLPWIIRGFEGREKWTGWREPVQTLVREGVISWKCAFVMWAAPPAVGMELGFVALLCWVRMRYTSLAETLADVTPDASPGTSKRNAVLVSSVKQVAGWLCALVLIIWIQATMSATGEREFNQIREDMSDEVLGLAVLVFLGMSLWVYDTLGPAEVAAAKERSKMVQETWKLLQNDWVRAFVFLLAGVPIVVFAIVERIQSHLRGGGKDRTFKPLLQWTVSWDGEERGRWTSILVKASWLGILYVSCLVGIMKFFAILLAEVNEHFSGWPVFTVSAVMFFIALAIFLFPASPGPPIYTVMGIVICSSASKQGWTFSEGLLWATFVAYAMKLCFTAFAQKLIGEPFSRNTWVRGTVGIHTPYMRAIEKILREPRVTMAKVSLVIGGPDWPIAVLCGIMRLSAWSILVCISPVLFQSVFPSVLAGALLLVKGDETMNSLSTHGMAEVTLMVAGGLQLVFGVVAFYHVQNVLEQHYEELTRSRPEDEELEEMNRRADAVDRAFWSEAAWEMLPCWMKAVLLCGLLCIEASVVLLIRADDCFKKFDLMSTVEKDLGGDVLAIVKPLGWVAMGLALVDALALCVFYLWSHVHVAGGARMLLDKDQLEKEGKAIISKGP